MTDDEYRQKYLARCPRCDWEFDWTYVHADQANQACIEHALATHGLFWRACEPNRGRLIGVFKGIAVDEHGEMWSPSAPPGRWLWHSGSE